MDKGTFGESLKREREMRGVTLEEISAATRIATRFLQAIETEQWGQLPGGVFNRGFVRAVARYLGLDEENTVAEYTLAVGDRQPVPVWTGSPPAVAPNQPWLVWVVAAAVIVALLAGTWFGARRFLARRAAKRAAQAATMNATPPPESAGVQQQASFQPVPPNNTAPAQDPTSGVPAASPASTPAISPALISSAPISSAIDRFELKIEAAKKTKVTVVVDKDVVYDGTMKAGKNQFFSAADYFQVSAKDAGALRLELNGKALAPMGPAGHSGKVTLTRDALKRATGGGN